MIDWDEFVNENKKPIFAYCLQFLGNYADAEDVTQDVFVRYFTDSQRGREMHRGWLYTVARNACIDKRRWFKRFTSFLKDSRRESVPIKISDDVRDVSELLPLLSPQQKEVFILRHWHGFSTADVAAMLAVSEGSIKTQLKRAIEKIKKGLSHEQD